MHCLLHEQKPPLFHFTWVILELGITPLKYTPARPFFSDTAIGISAEPPKKYNLKACASRFLPRIFFVMP